MDFCNYWELEEKVRSFEMKARLHQMNAQINRRLTNSYNMLDTAMTPPMFANYTVHYVDNQIAEMMPVRSERKNKIDIFEAMNLLIFPYDPIRDYTKREVEKINERFRKVESLLGL